MASESCLHNHGHCSEPIRQRRRVLDRDRSADRVQQIPESRSHASSDEAQHSPLQGNYRNSYKRLLPHSQSFVSKQQGGREITFLCICLFVYPVFSQAYQYGVYTRELLQFGDKVSMLLLLPSSEDFSSSCWPLVGTKEPGLTMPLQVFELGRWSLKKEKGIFQKIESLVLFKVATLKYLLFSLL